MRDLKMASQRNGGEWFRSLLSIVSGDWVSCWEGGVSIGRRGLKVEFRIPAEICSLLTASTRVNSGILGVKGARFGQGWRVRGHCPGVPGASHTADTVQRAH